MSQLRPRTPSHHALERNSEDGFGAAVPAAAADPVLRALAQAEESYRALRAAWDQDVAVLDETREEAARAANAEQSAAEELRNLKSQLEAERRRAAREKERAARLAAALKDVHAALFGGNVFDLILKACISLTGATRGLYITTWAEGQYRVRSAMDVEGYPGKPPSAFLRAVCGRAIDGGETFVANDSAALQRLPAPDSPGESFANLLAAPAVLLKHFNGVVILADKPGGGFDTEDVDLVLSIGDQAGVAIENRRLQDELLGSYFSVVGVLADAIEAKDPYTKGHCEMVARLARLTAVRLAASDDALRALTCYGGLLHDIGKIGVSDGVLNKPGRLLPEEWTLMQSHVRIGRDLLSHVPALEGVSDVVLHHHERYDGTGYPDGLAGEGISLAARIVCVVDAYCAMVSKRSYKEALSVEDARQELLRHRGTQFDPAVVDAFLIVLDTPEAQDDCPDGYGLLRELANAADLHHVLSRVRPLLST